MPKEEKPIPHVPMSPKSKNVGALTGLKVDKSDVERIASMEPEALKAHLKTTNLEPKVVDAVMKRHLEIQGSKPKEVKPKKVSPVTKKASTSIKPSAKKIASVKTTKKPIPKKK